MEIFMKTRILIALAGSLLLLLTGSLLALAAPNGGGRRETAETFSHSPALETDTCVAPWPQAISAPYSSNYKVCKLPAFPSLASPFGGIAF